ncbi:phosphotransferase enzyme family protein [Metabacillus niabensis]|uniref:Ser/Thr protein kinase RdoA (MazF antagonist) n=1 Tax=Metabacillus niabensis TaxID=324854 RepID=A0ABT9Z5C7_9BACI|nr:phosphotransferase [Metabacillus niabensis]MDQ0227417.1 Ser/Thr protein kinase RdoA (MazF antagonist) [Metabacillus niabensis]
MEKIIVRHSLIANESVISLMKNFDIGEIVDCQLGTRGLNDIYIVTTTDSKYIFRNYRHNWRQKSDVLYEIDALNRLTATNFPVSKPLKRKDGEWLSELNQPEGVRFGVLFTYTKGERPDIHPDNCYLIGEALGAIHKRMNSFHSTSQRTFELNLDYLLEQPFEIIKNNVQINLIKPKLIDFLQMFVEELKGQIATSDLDYGFCHGDFHNFNMHIDQGKLEIFDFDCCSYGYRAYDLSVFVWNLRSNYPHTAKECEKAFLSGYKDQYFLNSINFQLLDQFVMIRKIWFFATLIRNEDVWGTGWMNEQSLSTFMEELVQHKQNLE